MPRTAGLPTPSMLVLAPPSTSVTVQQLVPCIQTPQTSRGSTQAALITAMATAGSKVASLATRANKAHKYTVQPAGIWGTIHGWFSIDANRSSGVPLNPQYRNPPPGGNDPKLYDDAVTVPAADLADNPYWERDVRRSYPRLSVVRQPDVVALLSVGSAAAPKDDVLQIGDAGTKQLVEVKEEGEKGLSAYFEKNKSALSGVLGPGGMPPLPTSLHQQGKRYALNKDDDQTYASEYPCRTFV